MTHKEIKAKIVQWPMEEQLQLIQELSRSIRETIEAAAPTFHELTDDNSAQGHGTSGCMRSAKKLPLNCLHPRQSLLISSLFA